MSESKSSTVDEDIDNLVKESLELIEKWTNKEAGDFSQWMGLIGEVVKVIEKRGNHTQIENIKLSITVIQKLAVEYYKENSDNVSDEVKQVLDFVTSETGAFIMREFNNIYWKFIK